MAVSSIYQIIQALFLAIIFHAFISFTTYTHAHSAPSFLVPLFLLEDMHLYSHCLNSLKTFHHLFHGLLLELLDRSPCFLSCLYPGHSLHYMQNDISKTSVWNYNQHLNLNWFKTKPRTPIVFSVVINSNFVISIAKARSLWCHPCLLAFSHTTHPIHHQVLLAQPSEYNQNPTISHHLYSCQPSQATIWIISVTTYSSPWWVF